MSSVTLGQQQVKVWYGSAITKVVTNETVRALAVQWQHVSADRTATVEDFWHKPQSVIADYSIILIKGKRDYTYFHHGRLLQEKVGFGMQGKTLSELRTPMQRRMREIFDRCTVDDTPAYFQCFDEYERSGTLWGYLCMPIKASSDLDVSALFVYCHFIEDKPSIFRSLFDRSSYATIIAEPIPNQFGQIEDAWIVSRNAAGEKYCVNHLTKGVEVQLRQTALFSLPNMWEALTEAAQRGQGHVHVRMVDSDGPSRQVSVEMIDDRLVLRIAEVEEALVNVTLD